MLSLTSHLLHQPVEFVQLSGLGLVELNSFFFCLFLLILLCNNGLHSNVKYNINVQVYLISAVLYQSTQQPDIDIALSNLDNTIYIYRH